MKSNDNQQQGNLRHGPGPDSHELHHILFACPDNKEQTTFHF